MNKYCMIEIAFGNLEETNKTVDILLTKKLVASTHIIESNSSWNWHNKRENSKEYLVQMETKSSKQQEIYSLVKQIHSYDCFEFAVFEINSINDDYLSWIDKEVD